MSGPNTMLLNHPSILVGWEKLLSRPSCILSHRVL
jgi:hypothetical protein